MPDTRTVGTQKESLAKEELIKLGYKIIQTNYRVKNAEIDIIAKDKDDLVFVEVKYRASNAFGYPYEAVNKKKRDKIVYAALMYIKSNNLKNQNIRFDIISIEGNDKIEVIKAAFMPDARFIY